LGWPFPEKDAISRSFSIKGLCSSVSDCIRTLLAVNYGPGGEEARQLGRTPQGYKRGLVEHINGERVFDLLSLNWLLHLGAVLVSDAEQVKRKSPSRLFSPLWPGVPHCISPAPSLRLFSCACYTLAIKFLGLHVLQPDSFTQQHYSLNRTKVTSKQPPQSLVLPRTPLSFPLLPPPLQGGSDFVIVS